MGGKIHAAKRSFFVGGVLGWDGCFWGFTVSGLWRFRRKEGGGGLPGNKRGTRVAVVKSSTRPKERKEGGGTVREIKKESCGGGTAHNKKTEDSRPGLRAKNRALWRRRTKKGNCGKGNEIRGGG